MAAIQRQIEVNAPAEKVFGYVADIPRHVEWAGHKLQITPDAAGPVAAGSTFTCVGQQMGTHHGKVTVTDLAPNTRLVYESDDDTGHFRHFFLLTEEGGATKVIKGVEPGPRSPLFKIMLPLLKATVIPRGLEGDLKRIKAKLEQGAG